mmetsp:Transcript_9838/g.26779  ORF Transcript_9838/g.26779 Transcript_9838/m.26779 type:complete len:390 (-) Transcript_9838:1186-2355(-)
MLPALRHPHALRHQQHRPVIPKVAVHPRHAVLQHARAFLDDPALYSTRRRPPRSQRVLVDFPRTSPAVQVIHVFGPVPSLVHLNEWQQPLLSQRLKCGLDTLVPSMPNITAVLHLHEIGRPVDPFAAGGLPLRCRGVVPLDVGVLSRLCMAHHCDRWKLHARPIVENGVNPRVLDGLVAGGLFKASFMEKVEALLAQLHVLQPVKLFDHIAGSRRGAHHRAPGYHWVRPALFAVTVKRQPAQHVRTAGLDLDERFGLVPIPQVFLDRHSHKRELAVDEHAREKQEGRQQRPPLVAEPSALHDPAARLKEKWPSPGTARHLFRHPRTLYNKTLRSPRTETGHLRRPTAFAKIASRSFLLSFPHARTHALSPGEGRLFDSQWCRIITHVSL